MSVDQASELQEWLIAFVRDFGLHDPERTPCGQPMSVSEAHALTELARRPELRQQELGDRLRLQKSTVSRLVSQLTGRGWVQRARAADDGRGIVLALTDRGARVAAQVVAARRSRCEDLLNNIPSERRAEVLDALRVLKEAVSAEVPRR
jgi:DNA-binding MarR family transcriptional regulator